MRIDKRKGLNEVTQQGSYSSQHDIFFTPLSGYIMRVCRIVNALLQSQSSFSIF